MDDAIGNVLKQENDLMHVPDLDWMQLKNSNIPSEFPVESIPQLQQAWTHTSESNTRLVPNMLGKEAGRFTDKKATQEDISGVVKQAKKEMMQGLTGKALADRLASLYMPDLIIAAKDELVKLAGEQGLLGKVYLDISPFESCAEASKVLGRDRVRLAKYVTGNPTRKVCSSHHNGYCKELGKRVVASMDYNEVVLSEFTNHLRVAGVIGATEKIASKENLREAFLSVPEKLVEMGPREATVDMGKVHSDFADQLEKSAGAQEKMAATRRFFEARPILAHMQNQMLKGKVGEALKASIREKLSSEDIVKFSSEISKAAGLQGLLGNIYVDVSLYKTAEEAIQAIKTASTNPIYLIQSYAQHDFDSTLTKVASATGCSVLPRDGKLDKKVVFSYIKDLQMNNRIASDVSQSLLNKVIAGDCSLDVVKEAFDATLTHKKEVRVGGVMGSQAPAVTRQAVDRGEVRGNVLKALEAGVSADLVESKVASLIGTTEAVGMIRDVLAHMGTVNANCLTKCTSERYDISRVASIVPGIKCKECVLKSPSACIKQSAKFAGSVDLDKAFFDFGKEAGKKKKNDAPKGDKPEIEDVTKNVLLEENPDVEREDITQEYDMSTPGGSGMNITLDEMHKRDSKEASFDIDLGSGAEGMDRHLD